MIVGLAVTCRVCGDEHEPSAADVRAGTWQTCEACKADTVAADSPQKAPRDRAPRAADEPSTGHV
jgi:hypothetical protein